MPKDPRTAWVNELARTIGWPEADDEALEDLRLLREIDKRDKDNER